MNKFAQLLQKYYKREGNKVIFNNSYNLNKLSLCMWEAMGYKSMDPSILSRVINGQRLFTNMQLSVFCKILNIESKDRSELYKALMEERAKVDDMATDYTNHLDIDYIRVTAETIETLNKQESSRLVIDMSHKVGTWIYSKFNSETNINIKKETFRLYSGIILQQAISYNILTFPQKYLPYTYNINKHLITLHKDTREKEVLGNAYFITGMGCYVNNISLKALKHYTVAIDNLSNVNLKIHALRDICISAARLLNKGIYNKFKKVLISEIEKGDWTEYTEISAAYEGLAKSEMLFNNQAAFTYLNTAYNIFLKDTSKKGSYKNLFYTQMLKSEYEIFSKFYPTDKTIQKKLLEALEISKNKGFKRYKHEINKLLAVTKTY